MVTLATAIAVAGCGDTPSDGTAVMQMFDNRYAPDLLVVDVGSTVEFPNEGRVDHNVIDANGAFDSREPSGEDQKPGETWTYTFTEPGVYNIFCSLHAVQNKKGEWEGMVATIEVTASPNS